MVTVLDIMLKIDYWILDYQDWRGYRRKRRFGSYRQAMKYAAKEALILFSLQAQRSLLNV